MPHLQSRVKTGSPNGYIQIAPNAFIETIKIDDGKFDPWYWQSQRISPVSRTEMFDRFLKQYNLIGMPLEKAVKFLSLQQLQPDGDYSTWLEFRCDTDQSIAIVIHGENGKVVSWAFRKGRHIGNPITSNVVLKFDRPEQWVNDDKLMMTKRK